MSARHWSPPAFLLPSWSEVQLALLHGRLVPALRPRVRAYSSGPRSSDLIAPAICAGNARKPERRISARSVSQCKHSSTTAKRKHDEGWGSDAVQKVPGSAPSQNQGLKLRYFIQRDADDKDWRTAKNFSPEKEVSRLLTLNSKRKSNGSRNTVKKTRRQAPPLEDTAGSMKDQNSEEVEQDTSSNQAQLALDGLPDVLPDVLPAERRGEEPTEQVEQDSRIRESEHRADEDSYVSLNQLASRSLQRKNSALPPVDSAKKAKAIEDQRKLSLLEELFPELAAMQRESLEGKPARREVPRLRIADINFSTSTSNDPEDDDLPPPSQSGELPPPRPVVKRFEDNEVAVLVFRTYDKTLSEADFARIVPRGYHIEEWREHGTFLQVIPVRNSSSLAAVGHYLLLFRNADYRAAYKRSAERLAALSAHAAHRDGRDGNGNNRDDDHDDDHDDDGGTSALANEYALTPQPQLGDAPASLFFREGDVRASRVLRRLVEQRGYDKLAGRAGRTVLFWVDGYAPLDGEVRGMLRADGRDRGVAWSATGRVERIEIARNPLALSEDADGERDEFGDADGGGGAAAKATAAAAARKPDAGWDHDRDFDSDVEEDGDQAAKKKPYQRWLLEFDDEIEARRFVRLWHLRLWPKSWVQRHHRGEPDARVHAEFLW